MELLLTIHTRQFNVHVTCDGQPSHTFYLHPAMILDTPAEVFLPPSDPVAHGIRNEF